MGVCDVLCLLGWLVLLLRVRFFSGEYAYWLVGVGVLFSCFFGLVFGFGFWLQGGG